MSMEKLSGTCSTEVGLMVCWICTPMGRTVESISVVLAEVKVFSQLELFSRSKKVDPQGLPCSTCCSDLPGWECHLPFSLSCHLLSLFQVAVSALQLLLLPAVPQGPLRGKRNPQSMNSGNKMLLYYRKCLMFVTGWGGGIQSCRLCFIKN